MDSNHGFCSPAWRPVAGFAAAFVSILACCTSGNPAVTEGPALVDRGRWGARTVGGRGGRFLRVTTLAGSGEGSLRAAAEAQGRRVVVFEVGGVIDLDGRNIRVRNPHLTIAGETAPAPGITVIRGGLRLETHDVVVRHLRIRPGEGGHEKQSGWEIDAITTAGRHAHDIIVDHCSLSWATDENLSATGPRFDGTTPAEWRLGTSRRITFSDNIIAECLSHSTHSKGEHSKGTLIHDNVTEVKIVRNLYAHNVQRNPFFKGGSSGLVANNLIYDPGSKAVHYALRADEWGDRRYQTGKLIVVGNVLKPGPASDPGVSLVLIEGEGPVVLHEEDNLILDRSGRSAGQPRIVRDPARLRRPLDGPIFFDAPGLLPATRVFESVLRDVGARPWDRDETDKRIILEVRRGGGRIIDSEEQVGGYPKHRATQRPFLEKEWDCSAEPFFFLGRRPAGRQGDARDGAGSRF